MTTISNTTREALTACDNIPVTWGVTLDGILAFIQADEESAKDRAFDLKATGAKGVKIIPVQVRNA